MVSFKKEYNMHERDLQYNYTQQVCFLQQCEGNVRVKKLYSQYFVHYLVFKVPFYADITSAGIMVP